MKLNATQLLLLHIKAAGLPQPKLEYCFAPPRRWRFDCSWKDAGDLRNKLIAAEIEGGVFGIGKPCRACGRRRVAGHSSIERLIDDMAKYNAAAELGWLVFRFTPRMVIDGTAIKQLKRVLQ